VIVNKEAKEYLIKKLYEVFSLYDFNGQEKEVAKIFKALSHPWALKIYQLLVEHERNDPASGISPIRLAEELYKWHSSEKISPRKGLPRYYVVGTHRIINRLVEAGIVEKYGGVVKQSKVRLLKVMEKNRRTKSDEGKKMAKPKKKEFIEVNMKDICFITNNPGPVCAPITDEMLERAIHELRSRKKRRK
jgi:DNA-binding transcriptional ArsR family regulator